MARPISKIELTQAENVELRRRARAATSTQRDSLRARIILARAEGCSEEEVSHSVGVSLNTVSLWSKRFEELGLAGLADKTGRGRKPTLPPEKVRQAISAVGHPPPGRQRWSTRGLGAALGISHQSVQTIWSKHDLTAHPAHKRKVFPGARFNGDSWDVIGLYLHPPDRALVLYCDEKHRRRTTAGADGEPAVRFGVNLHEHQRYETLKLLAALTYLDSKLIPQDVPADAHVEWLRFVKQIYHELPKALTIHIIADSGVRHEHPHVREWLTQHPRIQMHFAPVGSAWMSVVEQFFIEQTEGCHRDGNFPGVDTLSDSIMEYVSVKNRDPGRYIWKGKQLSVVEEGEIA